MKTNPNCTWFVEDDICSHPSMKKTLWIFDPVCILCRGYLFCSLQNPYPKPERPPIAPPKKL